MPTCYKLVLCRDAHLLELWLRLVAWPASSLPTAIIRPGLCAISTEPTVGLGSHLIPRMPQRPPAAHPAMEVAVLRAAPLLITEHSGGWHLSGRPVGIMEDLV